jgi:hypothetical protein
MSSEIPPSPITTGFNENAWIQPPLTNALANRNYLLKIRPDTANVVETFTAGIKTNTINPTTSSGIVAIGNVTTNNTEIGAVTGRSTILHIGDGDTSSGNILIGSGADSTGNVQILNGSYGAGIAAGSVNILNGTHNATTTGGDVLIHRGNANGEFNVGNALSTINLNAGTTNVTNLTTINPITTTYTALPSASNQLGYRNYVNVATFTLTTSPLTVNSLTVTSGTWMLVAKVYALNLSSTYVYSISETNNAHQSGIANYTIQGSTNGTQEAMICGVVATTSASKPYYLVGNAGTTGGTITNVYFYATRLA